MSPLMLLDTASLYFRAFYGVPDRRAPDEPPRDAVTGLVDMMATLVETYRPSGIVACWDDDWRPAFRVEAIPSYKAHRVAESGSAGGEDVPEASGSAEPLADDTEAIALDDEGGTPTPSASAADRYADDPIGTDIPADDDEDLDAWSLTGRG